MGLTGRPPIEEFSKRDSMSNAIHGTFAYVPWPFASAEMPGSARTFFHFGEYRFGSSKKVISA
jgi:hypothetical protein